MASSFLEGMMAGYGIAIPVGAVAILIVNTALARGFAAGFVAGAGAATADLLYAALAAFAGVALSTVLAPLATATRLIGGAALVALGIWGLRKAAGRSPAQGAPADAHRPLRTYLNFVGITLLNPLTIVYFTAFILGRGTATGGTAAAGTAFVFGAGLASLSWQTLLAGLGGLAGRRITPRFRTLAVIAGNLLVCTLGLRLLILAVLQIHPSF
jgi:threonine/homoserine/homoserine lactone efflux protein